MELYTKKLFSEICRRGCFIETQKNYPIEHLPGCLVSTNDKLIFDFKIRPIVPKINGMFAYFRKKHRENGYDVTVWIRNKYINISFVANEPELYKHDLINLDFLIYYLYTYNKEFDSNIQPGKEIYKYILHLKSNMVQNLIELYLHKFMYLTNILSIIEIKIVIVEAFIKLDKWYDLFIY